MAKYVWYVVLVVWDGDMMSFLRSRRRTDRNRYRTPPGLPSSLDDEEFEQIPGFKKRK